MTGEHQNGQENIKIAEEKIHRFESASDRAKDMLRSARQQVEPGAEMKMAQKLTCMILIQEARVAYAEIPHDTRCVSTISLLRHPSSNDGDRANRELVSGVYMIPSSLYRQDEDALSDRQAMLKALESLQDDLQIRFDDRTLQYANMVGLKFMVRIYDFEIRCNQLIFYASRQPAQKSGGSR